MFLPRLIGSDQTPRLSHAQDRHNLHYSYQQVWKTSPTICVYLFIIELNDENQNAESLCTAFFNGT